MEREVARAILLKAVLEFLQKETKLSPSDLGEQENIPGRGEFLRVNATAGALRSGLPSWKDAVKKFMEARLLPDSLLQDESFKFALKYAVDDELPNTSPRAPNEFSWRRWLQPAIKPIVLAELGGTWVLLRKSGRNNASGAPFVNVSLLNIRPSRYYETHPSAWTLFALWTKDENATRLRRTDGACAHIHNSLHLIGMQDNTTSPLPTALSLRHDLGGERTSAARERAVA